MVWFPGYSDKRKLLKRIRIFYLVCRKDKGRENIYLSSFFIINTGRVKPLIITHDYFGR